MPRPNSRLASHAHSWTQRIAALSRIPALIRELGADPARVFAAAGLSSDALDDPDGRVAYAELGALLHEAAEQTRCPHFGLLVGGMHHLHEHGVAGDLALNSPTVGKALRTFVAYQHLNSGGGLAFLLPRAGAVDFGYTVYHPGVANTTVIYDTVLAAALSFMRDLCGPAWAPCEVLIPYAQPRDVSAYRSFFKCKVRFNSETCALRFTTLWLQRPVEGASPELLDLSLRRADAMGEGPFVEQVFRTLRRLILNDQFDGNEVAQALSLHRRALNRRLRSEGTTLREVLDQVRFDVARQLLSDSEVPLDDIADMLGYANVSTFVRTFRRWVGTTPARWRRGGAPTDGVPKRMQPRLDVPVPSLEERD